jgi:release factor glutamine methyltransferase
MGDNLQTVKDIRIYLQGELGGLYPDEEIKAITAILLKSVLGAEKNYQIYLNDLEVSEEQVSSIKNICSGLKLGKPIQYLLGETTFYGCRLKLNSATFIPRQETEELVDLIILENQDFRGTLIDFGTGSGCIAIALALNLPGLSVTGTDNSAIALQQAEVNARLNNVKIRFINDDILDTVSLPEPEAGIIVSNPPYVRNSEKLLMKRNVLDFEPHSALFVDDSDPLVYYRAILRKADAIFNPGGKIYFEINEAFGEPMSCLIGSFGYRDIRIITDINGKDRIIKAIKS